MKSVAVVVALVALGTPACAAGSLGSARISPASSIADELQLYSVAVPSDRASAVTTRVSLALPQGFVVSSYVPSPGWRRSMKVVGAPDGAVTQDVTWTGGRVPAGEAALFEFVGQPIRTGRYAFDVTQTYSDGTSVNWSGPASSSRPAPTIEVERSFGGGRASTLSIVAVALAAGGALLGGVALFARGRRLA